MHVLAPRCRSPRLKVTSVTADQVIHAQRSDVPLIFRVEGGMGENDGARLFLAASVPEKVRNQRKQGMYTSPILAHWIQLRFGRRRMHRSSGCRCSKRCTSVP